MKKWLWFCSVMTLMVTLVIGCSSKEEPKEETSDKTSTDVKSELLDFYLSIANKINSVDGDLNNYFSEKDGLKDYAGGDDNQTSLNRFTN